MKIAGLVSTLLIAASCLAAEPIKQVRWLPLTPVEQAGLDALNSPNGKLHALPLSFTPYDIQRPRIPARVEVLGDRKVYLADDPVGQFLICFIGQDFSSPTAKLTVELTQGGSKVLSQEFSPVRQPKMAFLLDTGSLKPGKYVISAKLSGKTTVAIPGYEFEKSSDKHRAVAYPKDGVPLLVHSQEFVPNAEWPITTGIPLPRATSDTTDRFQLLEDGKPVAAQFNTRATWYPDGSQVKWMGLDFIARYQDGKPRDYKLKLLPEGTKAENIATPLKTTETDNEITVDTGKIRFTVNKHSFAGIGNVYPVTGGGMESGFGPLLVKGGGGPYLVDERGHRYEAANDEFAEVKLVEKGPVKATIYATGWYVCAGKNGSYVPGFGERLCQFRTQINAYAGQPGVDILHRTIITYDTDSEKLADLGFGISAIGQEQYQIGVDGQALNGTLPEIQMLKGKPLPAESVWVHQQRWNQCRILGAEKKLSAGKQSDGWASASGKTGAITVMLRNIWQLYPKELELSREAVTVHFWPKHGMKVYTEEEELDRHNLYKFFYAHQGQYLDLKFPQNYYNRASSTGMGFTGVMMEQQDVNAIAACGQGLAVSNNFSIAFATMAPADIGKQARLYQQNPHAIAEPAWNAKTEVEGRFSAMDKKRFPDIEKTMDEGYRSNTITPAMLEEYGMWIWPDTHNNWSPVSKLPEWHRLWNNGHYQNVWESWLLYLRSGEPWTIEWARDNTAHFMDVGTVNYDDPRHQLQGHVKGAMYHTKGLLPWGSPRYGQECGDDYVEVGSHFINPDAFIISYLVMGDPRGQELMNAWGKAFDREALPPERSRECNTTLNQMLSYYVTTWDPQAIQYISDLAPEAMSWTGKEHPGLYMHAFYGRQWPRRYWELTRDHRIQDYVMREWEAGAKGGGYIQLAALLYDWTKDVKYLQQVMPGVSIFPEAFYWNPRDPLDGFGPRLGDLGSASFVQKAPYYLQACIDAGIPTIPLNETGAKPVAKTTSLPKAAPVGIWSNVLSTTAGADYGGHAFAYLMPGGAEPTAKLDLTAWIAPNIPTLPSGVGVTYVRVTNADGKVLFEGGLLGGSLRPSATVTLDARNDKGPWKLYMLGTYPTLMWTGSADTLFVGPTAEQVKAAAEAKK